MTLRHMNIFLCVCDENNMTKAAGKLHMTQPSVSLAIQELEEHYGIRLFERLGKRLFLTPAGKKLLTYARHIVNLNEETERAMHDIGGMYRLRLGASVTIGESVLVDLLQYLYQVNPRQEILSEIHNTAELETMLLKDELDIALVEGEIQSEYLVTEAFMEDELVYVASVKSIFARDGLHAEDLSKTKFFIRENGSGTRDLFEQEMKEKQIKYKVAGVYNNAEAIKKAVEAGLGISVISKRAVRHEIRQGRLISFSLPETVFKRKFRLVYHKNKYISPHLLQLIELCREIDGII